MAVASTIHRKRWSFQRNECWFEATLPHLGDDNFRQDFRVSSTTFRYLIESCRSSHECQETNFRETISVEKRVPMGLNHLCSYVEDRTIAHLFGFGRIVTLRQLEKHIKECFSVNGFPQAVGAIDSCHFTTFPPKEHADDSNNYKGWYRIILLAVVDQRYCFKYTSESAQVIVVTPMYTDGHGFVKKIECSILASPVAIIESCLDSQDFQALYMQPCHTTMVSTGQGKEVQAPAKYFWSGTQQNIQSS
ncbi:hypothetical protein MRX96_047140 [Rhipicephalus microplus]